MIFVLVSACGVCCISWAITVDLPAPGCPTKVLARTNLVAVPTAGSGNLYLFNELCRTGSGMLFGQLINRCDGQLSFVMSFSGSLYLQLCAQRAKSS